MGRSRSGVFVGGLSYRQPGDEPGRMPGTVVVTRVVAFATIGRAGFT